MRSTSAEGGQSTLPSPPSGAHPRLDRVAAATFEQMKTALLVLSTFDPDAFDCAMDAAEPGHDNPRATAEAEPMCAICGGSVGIFLGIGPDWQHFLGDGTTAGAQQVYDPGHAPALTWHLQEDLRTQQ